MPFRKFAEPFGARFGRVLGLGGGAGVTLVTATFNPATNLDDCNTQSPATLTDGNLMTMGDNTIIFNGYVRFRSVTIPKDATIVAAKVTFESAAAHGDTIHLRIKGEANATPAIFSTYANANGRVRTTAFVDWDDFPKYANNVNFDTPDIASIIDEITSLAGWASGNDLVVIVENNASSVGARQVAYQYNVGRGGPTLTVTYHSP